MSELNSTVDSTITYDSRRLKKRLKKIGWGLFWLLFGAQILALVPQSIFLGLADKGLIDATLAQWLAVDISIYLLGAPMLLLAIKDTPTFEIPKHDYPFNFKHLLCTFILLLGSLYTFNLLGNGITYLVQLITGHEASTIVTDSINSSGSIITFIFVVLVGPILEELLFRKLLIDHTFDLGEKYAVIFSGITFGLFHCNLNQSMYATILGFILGYIYVKTGSLKYPIILHILTNLFGSFLVPLFIATYPEMEVAISVYVILVIILSVIIFIKNYKRIKLDDGEIPLTLSQKLKMGMLNPGYIIYTLIVILLIIFILLIL